VAIVERFKVTPTVTAGAYSANDVVGGRLRFAGLHSGTLHSITICDNAAQSVDYVVVLFESQPTDIADNATFDIADADLAKIIYQDTLAASSTRQAFTDNSYSFLYSLDVPLISIDDDVWGFLITAGTPTYAATSDVTITLQVEIQGLRAGISS
jgi:hypothetical protein